MENHETPNEPKRAVKYCCDKCDYITYKKSNYKRHINSKKHYETNAKHKTSRFYCDYCKCEFKSRTTLWRHKQNCSIIKILEENEQLKNDKIELMNKMLEDKNQTINNITNNITNNNTFNLQIYLNENYKNAMNLGDFIKSLKLTSSDLKYSLENGKIEGVSNIIIKGLTNLEETDRPVHCTDRENSVLYVKDNDNWEEDCEHKIIEKGISNIEQNHKQLIKDWEENHPLWFEDDNLKNEYIKIVKETMNDLNKEEKQKVIKNMSKIVNLDKNK
jgi:hypothetical protein